MQFTFFVVAAAVISMEEYKPNTLWLFTCAQQFSLFLCAHIVEVHCYSVALHDQIQFECSPRNYYTHYKHSGDQHARGEVEIETSACIKIHNSK